MRPNVFKFQNDIKILVAKQKETGNCGVWMHPMYCAYYLIKHNVQEIDKFIEDDIKKSYKALPDEFHKKFFRAKVEDYYIQYGEETVRADR
jgi:hypothetical protein